MGVLAGQKFTALQILTHIFNFIKSCSIDWVFNFHKPLEFSSTLWSPIVSQFASYKVIVNFEKNPKICRTIPDLQSHTLAREQVSTGLQFLFHSATLTGQVWLPIGVFIAVDTGELRDSPNLFLCGKVPSSLLAHRANCCPGFDSRCAACRTAV
jgi:hypothetical protein